jgi:hypothetical protein
MKKRFSLLCVTAMVLSAVMVFAGVKTTPVRAEDVTIGFVDIGNVWTNLTDKDTVPFTAEINPNVEGLTDQMAIDDEIWSRVSDSTKQITLKKNGKTNMMIPDSGKMYQYKVVVRAKNGFVFGDSFEFVYGGHNYGIIQAVEGDVPAGTVGYQLSSDKKSVTISGFINNVTVKYSSASSKSNKAAQPMKVKAKKKTLKFKKLKKKDVKFKAITVKNAQGRVSYRLVGTYKNIRLNTLSGKITVVKGTKKGTYKVRIRISANGNTKYKAGNKTVTVKIKVK